MSTTDRLYGPDVPDDVIRQRNDWSCAVRSAYAALWTLAQLGLAEPVTYGDGGPRDVYEWMVPTYDSADVGLHQANGAGLVKMLRDHGYRADRTSPATLEDVQAIAGTKPVLLGLNNWGPAGHWVYVRGAETDGTLILENPAGTYAGFSDRLRDSFSRLGPATMVWIDVEEVAAPGTSPSPAPDVAALRAQVAALEAQVASLTADLVAARSALGVASVDYANGLQDLVNALRALKSAA